MTAYILTCDLRISQAYERGPLPRSPVGCSALHLSSAEAVRGRYFKEKVELWISESIAYAFIQLTHQSFHLSYRFITEENFRCPFGALLLISPGRHLRLNPALRLN